LRPRLLRAPSGKPSETERQRIEDEQRAIAEEESLKAEQERQQIEAEERAEAEHAQRAEEVQASEGAELTAKLRNQSRALTPADAGDGFRLKVLPNWHRLQARNR
jgi:hypothetical protein